MKEQRLRDHFDHELAVSADITPKQRAILQASLDLFAEKGFEQTSTSDIATRAGVAEGTVYRRYKTKTAIRDAVLTPIYQNIMPQIATEFTAAEFTRTFPGLAAFLEDVVTDRLHFVEDNQKELKVVFETLLVDMNYRKLAMDNVQKFMLPVLFKTFKQLKADHLMVAWPDELIIQTIMSFMLGYLGGLVFQLPRMDFDRQQQFIVASLTKLLSPAPTDPDLSKL